MAIDEDLKSLKEDLDAFKERFFSFVDNDFKHLELQVAGVKGEQKLTRGMLIAILSAVLALFLANIFGLHIGV